MEKLAPIGISTYSRIIHLKQTVEALKKNTLAKKSNLYVFSDAPKIGDEEAVKAVRDYLKTIDGFKSVNIVERETNNRTFNNRSGIKKLLNDYGKMIFLEEDVVTSPFFLQYMNNALKYYQDNKRIMSISGYCPPFNSLKNMTDDVFFLPRFNAWGFGIWRDRYESIRLELKNIDFYKILFDSFLRKKVIREIGADFFNMLKRDANGEIDALDVKIMYHQLQNDLYTVYPTNSLTENIGFDGTGLHCNNSERFKVEIDSLKKDHVFINQVELKDFILEDNKNFRKLGKKGGVILLLKAVGVFSIIEYLKKKIFSWSNRK